MKPETVSDREIVITRIIDAPRERVFEAMTDPKQVVKWWGPYGFSTTIHEMDVRPGGVWKQTMHGPDGKNYANKTIFNEIIKPERITYTHSGGEEDASSPVCFQAEWKFEVEGKNKTKLTIRMVSKTDESHKNATERYHAVEGGHQTLARLGDFLAGDTEPFIISRTFDAPRELVWKVWTEAEHMANWYSPKGFARLQSKMDFRPGGTYHYGLKSPGGEAIWGKIFYRRIKAPELLIYVNCFSDADGGVTRHPLSQDPWPLEMLSTITLAEADGKTLLTVKWVPINPTPEEKAAFEKGRPSMTQGWGGTFDQFTGYLKEVKG